MTPLRTPLSPALVGRVKHNPRPCLLLRATTWKLAPMGHTSLNEMTLLSVGSSEVVRESLLTSSPATATTLTDDVIASGGTVPAPIPMDFLADAHFVCEDSDSGDETCVVRIQERNELGMEVPPLVLLRFSPASESHPSLAEEQHGLVVRNEGAEEIFVNDVRVGPGEEALTSPGDVVRLTDRSVFRVEREIHAHA